MGWRSSGGLGCVIFCFLRKIPKEKTMGCCFCFFQVFAVFGGTSLKTSRQPKKKTGDGEDLGGSLSGFLLLFVKKTWKILSENKIHDAKP